MAFKLALNDEVVAVNFTILTLALALTLTLLGRPKPPGRW